LIAVEDVLTAYFVYALYEVTHYPVSGQPDACITHAAILLETALYAKKRPDTFKGSYHFNPAFVNPFISHTRVSGDPDRHLKKSA
jgi:hypothetical protein